MVIIESPYLIIGMEDISLQPISISHEGVERHCILSIPPNPGPHPLVIVLHGGGGTGALIARVTGFDAIARKCGFLAAFPDAVDRRWNTMRTAGAGVDDVGFLSMLQDHLRREHGAAPEPAVLIGASNGGMMAMRFALDRPEETRGVMAVMSALPEDLANRAWPRQRRSIPFLLIHGDADPIVRYEGGEVRIQRQVHGRCVGFKDTVRFWTEHNACPAEMIHREDHEGYHVEFHPGVDGEKLVTACTVAGGGHTWPGGEQYMPEWLIGPTSQAFSASEWAGRFVYEALRYGEMDT